MNISPAIQKAIGRASLQLQKHSPAILTVVGIAAVGTSAVLAAKNTLKLEETLDRGQDRIRWTKEQIDEGEVKPSALAYTYTHNALDVVKLYAAPTTLMVFGILCTLGAQNILHKRNAALAAAYKGLESAFSAYRERVREEYGDEVESNIRYGLRDEEETDKKGKTVVRKVPVEGQHVGSEYRFVYDISNPNWSGFHDQNLFRLQMAQNMYNDLLKTQGHILLHEVLDTLGFKRTQASTVVGWIYDPNNPDHKGDNFIEFNIRDYQHEYGYILLDFNVDGTIFDKI